MVTIGNILYSDGDYKLEINVKLMDNTTYTTYICPCYNDGIFRLLRYWDNNDIDVVTICDCSSVIDKYPLPKNVALPDYCYDYERIFYQPTHEILNLLVNGIATIYPGFEVMKYGFDKRLIAMAKCMYFKGSSAKNPAINFGEMDLKTGYSIARVGEPHYGNESIIRIIFSDSSNTIVTLKENRGKTDFYIGEYPYNSISFSEGVKTVSIPDERVADYSPHYVSIYHSHSHVEIGRIFVSSPYSGEVELIPLFSTEPFSYDTAVKKASHITIRAILGILLDAYEKCPGDMLHVVAAAIVSMRGTLAHNITNVVNTSGWDELNNSIKYSQSIHTLTLYAINALISAGIDSCLEIIPDDMRDRYKEFLYSYFCYVKGSIGYVTSLNDRKWLLRNLPLYGKSLYLYFGDLDNSWYFEQSGIAILKNTMIYALELPLMWENMIPHLTSFGINKLRDDYPVYLMIGDTVPGTSRQGQIIPMDTINKYTIIRSYTAKELRDQFNIRYEPDGGRLCKVQYPLYIVKDATGWIITIKEIYDGYSGEKMVIDDLPTKVIMLDNTSNIIGDLFGRLYDDSLTELHASEICELNNVFTFTGHIKGSPEPVTIGKIFVEDGESAVQRLVEKFRNEYCGKSYHSLIANEFKSPIDIIGNFCTEVIDRISNSTKIQQEKLTRNMTVTDGDNKKRISYYCISAEDDKFIKVFNDALKSAWITDQIQQNSICFWINRNTNYTCTVVYLRDRNIDPSTATITNEKDIYPLKKLSKFRYLELVISEISIPIVIVF